MKRFIITMLIILSVTEIVTAKACLENIKITKVTDGDTVKGIINGKEMNSQRNYQRKRNEYQTLRH